MYSIPYYIFFYSNFHLVVSFDKTRKLWVAQIGFQGKNYSLGKFKKIEDAEKARKDAEDRFFKPIIDKYKKD